MPPGVSIITAHVDASTAERKQADWERKKQKHWKYDQEYGTTTLFR
ncbi:MAG: hypothetical protein MJ074_06415 [Oscillospiraceae bacterium]|nr:hypothetical protein [Oscillospiraceae bacterium]